ncbi:MAG: hypothetical protein PWR20_1615 [Bacteroidales bacterium]|jgi:hypothetical protein|nr:hypothetical protein [Bacteroidales bacterium]MDN5330730.1 hypothetical protein [Bacteroidales bacterium]
MVPGCFLPGYKYCTFTLQLLWDYLDGFLLLTGL